MIPTWTYVSVSIPVCMCVLVFIPLWCHALQDNVRTLDIAKSGSAFLENRRVYTTIRGRLLINATASTRESVDWALQGLAADEAAQDGNVFDSWKYAWLKWYNLLALWKGFTKVPAQGRICISSTSYTIEPEVAIVINYHKLLYLHTQSLRNQCVWS